MLHGHFVMTSSDYIDHLIWPFRMGLFLENLIKLAPNPTIVSFSEGCQHSEKRHKSQKKTTFWFFERGKKGCYHSTLQKKVSCWSLAELKQVLSMYFRCQRCNALDLCVVCQAFQSSPDTLHLYWNCIVYSVWYIWNIGVFVT